MAFRRDRTAATGLAGRFLALPGDWEDEDGGPSRAGWTVSAAGHVGLVLFLLFGGVFDGPPLPPVEVAQVTVISEEEFALLTRPDEAPVAGQGVTAPAAPQPPSQAPRPPARPEIAEAPADLPEPPGPAELTAPPPVEAAPEPPAPEAAPRVAPEAAPEAPPEVAEAPEAVEEIAPAEEVEPEPPAEEREPAAPPEAAPEIVTEAERPSGAPDAAPRPRSRPDRVARLDPGSTVEATSERATAPERQPEPERPAPQPVETPPAEPAEDDLAAAIAGALADAISNTPQGAPQTGAAAGPPLSQGEMDAFRFSVQRCWIVDPGSPAASVTVVVGMRLTRDAKPDTASIRQLGARGGDDAATRTAFEAARRAILRCGAEGFPLPAEKYDRWAEVEMTFNPEDMRIR